MIETIIRYGGFALKHPFVYGRPLKGNEFLGYEGELQSIFNRIQQGDSSAIIGNPHVGKTSLLLQIGNRNVQQKYLGKIAYKKCYFKYLDLLAIEDNYTPSEFWSDVLSAFKGIRSKAIRKQLSNCKRKKFDHRELEKLFTALNKDGEFLVLALDEFERLLSHKNFQTPAFYGFLRSLSTRVSGLCLVIASRYPVSELIKKGKSILDVGSPFFQMANFYLQPFTTETIRTLLNRANPLFGEKEINFIYRVSGSNPFLLQAMAASMSELSGNAIENIAESFYDRVGHHFDDVWSGLNDSTRTVAVIISLKDLDGRALGSIYNYGEIERTDKFGIELNNLRKHGLAQVVEKSQTGWIFDSKYLLIWRGEKWALTSQAFSWWILQNVIAQDRKIPSVTEWLQQHKYIGFITKQQWDNAQSLFKKAPTWVISGVAGLAKSLWDEIIKN